MYCRTDTSWLYCSRGEASFLTHHWKVRIENWTKLAWSEVFELWNSVCYRLNPQIWCAWV